jgi:hypothetical protein
MTGHMDVPHAFRNLRPAPPGALADGVTADSIFTRIRMGAGMHRNRRPSGWALVTVSLVLLGCHSKNSVEAHNETPQAVATKVAQSGIKPRAGRWEATTQVDKMDMPGMTPQAREAMQKAVGRKTTFASCLTQAEADKPEASFFENKNSHCKFDDFSMADGKIDATMTCNENGATRKTTMSGTYASDFYKIRMDMNGTDRGKPMTMSMSTEAHRVGECRGNEIS